jgi:NAD(P)-dependent dehydrogenase (short-subunit alcohol dehydrogenase family)
VVTGAAAGIGQAISYRLAEAGADLDLVDVDADHLCAAGNALEALGVDIQCHTVDLSKKEERDGLWERLDAPDILVNNAGIYPCRNFLDVGEAFYAQVMAINMDSVYWMCQHMIRNRRKQGGTIINIGSIEAVQPFKEDLSHYSVSKAGVLALTRALAKEHARHGFRINAILPGGIVTQGTKAVAKQVLRFQLGLIKDGIEFRQRLPIRRLGRPDEVARMVVVLASELASYVQGAAIPVDGGFLAA